MSLEEGFGLMQVDWENRIDFARLRRECVEKAQKAMVESGVDLLFVFRTEDSRYLTSYRHHLTAASPRTGLSGRVTWWSST